MKILNAMFADWAIALGPCWFPFQEKMREIRRQQALGMGFAGKVPALQQTFWFLSAVKNNWPYSL